MNTKYIKYVAAAMMAVSLTACEDWLDSESYTESNTANFPTTMEDADMLVTAIYANLNHAASKPVSSYLMTSEIASDDRFGGGNTYDTQSAIEHLMIYNDTQFDFLWEIHYRGIYRANTAIEGITRLLETATNKEMANQLLGESYFLRAYYFYELAEIFGGVPLITSTTQEINSPRAEADEVWAQVGSDLIEAISLMSSKKYNEYVEAGHATKWAAEALLARAFLFYTGFYQKESMPLADGKNLSKAEVINYIDDCVQNSGHALIGDFRNLWTYTNEYTVNDYAYTKGVTGLDGQPLHWAGNNNAEEVFAVKFMNFCGYYYPYQEGYSNYFVPFFGFCGSNGNEDTFPFGNGNGFGPVAPSLWDEWQESEPNDMRLKASILRVEDEIDMSKFASSSVTGQTEYTGLYGKKMIPVLSYNAYQKQGTWVNSIFWAAYPEFDKANNYGMTQWGGHFQDLMVIRFADVLLMQSELKGDAEGMNKVRARAGLAPVNYSLEALQRERRHELCFEGLRWGDIRRWHIAETALKTQDNTTLENAGKTVVQRNGRYAERYAATNGFFPIPLAQIQLSNGVLTQNSGWDSADARFARWDFE